MATLCFSLPRNAHPFWMWKENSVPFKSIYQFHQKRKHKILPKKSQQFRGFFDIWKHALKYAKIYLIERKKRNKRRLLVILCLVWQWLNTSSQPHVTSATHQKTFRIKRASNNITWMLTTLIIIKYMRLLLYGRLFYFIKYYRNYVSRTCTACTPL